MAIGLLYRGIEHRLQVDQDGGIPVDLKFFCAGAAEPKKPIAPRTLIKNILRTIGFAG